MPYASRRKAFRLLDPIALASHCSRFPNPVIAKQEPPGGLSSVSSSFEGAVLRLNPLFQGLGYRERTCSELVIRL